MTLFSVVRVRTAIHGRVTVDLCGSALFLTGGKVPTFATHPVKELFAAGASFAGVVCVRKYDV